MYSTPLTEPVFASSNCPGQEKNPRASMTMVGRWIKSPAWLGTGKKAIRGKLNHLCSCVRIGRGLWFPVLREPWLGANLE